MTGYSAGGASSVIQPFFRGNNGMIRRIIPTGGGIVDYFAVNPWCCSLERFYNRTFEFASALNCSAGDGMIKI